MSRCRSRRPRLQRCARISGRRTGCGQSERDMGNNGPWSTEDYEAMCWHDVNVHGLRLDSFDERNGTADLILDIDYILQWHKSGDTFSFTVSPATLRFQQVFALKLELDYAQPEAGMCPFSIHEIEREMVEFPTGYRTYRWRISINWPKGRIEFQAPSFTQTLRGTPRVQAQQWLEPAKR